MDQFGLPSSAQYEQYVFNGNSVSSGTSWTTWIKPLGKSMMNVIAIGAGGGGGAGVIGAASTAGGGGGGGSGGMSIVHIPLALIPSRLYISVGVAQAGAGASTYVAIQPLTTSNSGTLAFANGGGVGGAASGATAGTAGAAANAASAANMAFGFAWAVVTLAGQAGIAGGSTSAGASLTPPSTGLRVTGGTGGGGLPAASTSGSAGGFIAGITAPSYFGSINGGVSPTSATTPPGAGQHGTSLAEAVFYYRGGTGGASTYGSATGAGLVQAPGGNGAIGSGGGGSGGALTGSTAAAASLGGAGQVIITCY